ncbi:hypothetical protein Adt_00348 [Abeliophyllum distichum]|uniref:Uncharacterized protein n=1 Tax=Abeliophyllum distichum TaxID=126358 RepID=A0ABD1VPT4_9LAMI
MTGDEEWVEEAMSDDNKVVELLLRLNQSYPQPTAAALKPTALPLDWSVRQRRSKPMAVDSTMKSALRASPTTPLSWSGATSISGGGGSAGTVDGSPEESSRPSDPKLSKTARSEVNGNGEKSTKRSRKKKTLAELQVEEYLLDKEREELKREISALLTNLEKQKAMNDCLKRIKLESTTKRRSTFASKKAIPCQFQQKSEALHHVPPIFPPFVSGNDDSLHCYSPNGASEEKAVAPCEDKFELPDLNLTLEGEASFEVLCG